MLLRQRSTLLVKLMFKFRYEILTWLYYWSFVHMFVQPWHPLQLFQHLKLLHATLSYCTTPVIDLDCINLKWNFLHPFSFPATHQHTTPWTDKAQNMLSATFSFIWANTKISQVVFLENITAFTTRNAF